MLSKILPPDTQCTILKSLALLVFSYDYRNMEPQFWLEGSGQHDYYMCLPCPFSCSVYKNISSAHSFRLAGLNAGILAYCRRDWDGAARLRVALPANYVICLAKFWVHISHSHIQNPPTTTIY